MFEETRRPLTDTLLEFVGQRLSKLLIRVIKTFLRRNLGVVYGRQAVRGAGSPRP